MRDAVCLCLFLHLERSLHIYASLYVISKDAFQSALEQVWAQTALPSSKPISALTYKAKQTSILCKVMFTNFFPHSPVQVRDRMIYSNCFLQRCNILSVPNLEEISLRLQTTQQHSCSIVKALHYKHIYGKHTWRT